MIVRFEKCELKIDEFHKEGIAQNDFVGTEKKVFELIEKWNAGETQFSFNTSGSTGKPKTILVSRKKIEYSANATMLKVDPLHDFKEALLCLNPEMIGGAMVVFRALIWNMNLIVIQPSSDPFNQIRKSKFDFASMVPMQIQNKSSDDLDLLGSILIGGAAPPSPIMTKYCKVYSTFGMTETVSHFALKEWNDEHYECIGDTQIEKQDDNSLTISGTLTDHKTLNTNDLIDFISPSEFKWLGRKDFIINSGGIKINPESVESKLNTVIDSSFLVSSIPDSKLGEMVVLIVEGKKRLIDVEGVDFEKFTQPKKVFFLSTFSYTKSGKIDRFKTRSKLISSLEE